MKQLLFILFLFAIIPSYSLAQTARMLEEDSFWYMQGQYLAGWPFPMPLYFVKGTIELDGKTYYKICEDNTIDAKGYTPKSMSIGDKYQDEGEGAEYYHILSVREEDGKVYAHKSLFPKSDYNGGKTKFELVGNEYLLFDFNLNIGDKFGLVPITVTNVEYYDDGNVVPRKMISFDSGHRILEGTGCILGNFMYYLDEPLYFVRGEDGAAFRFLLSGRGWRIENEMFPVEWLPTCLKGLGKEEGIGNNIIYDIEGRKVTSTYSPVIIKGGKKYINKK